MSNKTDFQAKNTRLNANNTDLSSILETINNLPEASSGGKIIVGDVGFGLSCIVETGITKNNVFKVSIFGMETAQIVEEINATLSLGSDGNYTGTATTSSGETVDIRIMPFSTIIPSFKYDQLISSGSSGMAYLIEMN